eukprot:scaffold5583_cov106-Isochrysis_galbana.AAC.5
MDDSDDASRAAARPDLPTPVHSRRPRHPSSVATAASAAARSTSAFARAMAAAPRSRAWRKAAIAGAAAGAAMEGRDPCAGAAKPTVGGAWPDASKVVTADSRGAATPRAAGAGLCGSRPAAGAGLSPTWVSSSWMRCRGH